MKFLFPILSSILVHVTLLRGLSQKKEAIPSPSFITAHFYSEKTRLNESPIQNRQRVKNRQRVMPRKNLTHRSIYSSEIPQVTSSGEEETREKSDSASVKEASTLGIKVVYPWRSIRDAEEGRVVVEISQQQANIIQSSGYSRLDEAALKAVRDFSFVEKMESYLLAFHFKLQAP